jgi:hypothetical protein
MDVFITGYIWLRTGLSGRLVTLGETQEKLYKTSVESDMVKAIIIMVFSLSTSPYQIYSDSLLYHISRHVVLHFTEKLTGF